MAVSSGNNNLCALILFEYLIGIKDIAQIHHWFFIYLKILLTPSRNYCVLAPANAFDSKGLESYDMCHDTCKMHVALKPLELSSGCRLSS